MRYKHMSIDVSGAMRRPKDFVGNITVDGRTLQTVKEVKDFFQSQLDMGRRLLPCGECDNFDYQTGCKGHKYREVEE